jgi:hypothetical protein
VSLPLLWSTAASDPGGRRPDPDADLLLVRSHSPSWTSTGAFLVSAVFHVGTKETLVIRVLVVLFWLSLIIGTLLARNIVANWAVALAGLYMLTRWWAARPKQQSRHAHAPGRSQASATMTAEAPRRPAARPTTTPVPPTTQSRWTGDRVHSAGRTWL